MAPSKAFSLRFALLAATAVIGLPLLAQASGIDTSGANDLPFNINGTQVMDMTTGGLAINYIGSNQGLTINGNQIWKSNSAADSGLYLQYSNPGGSVIIGGQPGASNNLIVDGEVIDNLTGAANVRMIGGAYGAMFRNDGGATYLLLTNAYDQFGSWNGLRPITVNDANGSVGIGQDLSVYGGLTANGGQTFSGNLNNYGSMAQNGNLAVAGEISVYGNNPIVVTSGGIQVAQDQRGCNASTAGTIQYVNGQFQGCNGSKWKSLVGSVYPPNQSITVYVSACDSQGNCTPNCTATTDSNGNVSINGVSGHIWQEHNLGYNSTINGTLCEADSNGLSATESDYNYVQNAFVPWQ